jgi:hypothetical protein
MMDLPHRGKNLVKQRPDGVGMLHFNGMFMQVRYPGPAFDASFFVTRAGKEKYIPGITNYYNNLPWAWAKHIAESHLTPDQPHYNLTVQSKVL